MKAQIFTITVLTLFLGMHAVAEGTMETAAGTTTETRRQATIHVPADYGSTPDQLVRVILPLLQENLPFPVSIKNSPGVSPFSAGPESSAFSANGHTWLGGNISAFLESPDSETRIFTVFEVPVVLAAAPSSPLVSFPDFLYPPPGAPPLDCVVSPAALSIEKSTAQRIGTDPGTRHIRLMESELVSGLEATIQGKAPCMAALSVELTEMMRIGKLKGLAVLSTVPLRIEGYGAVPPVSYWENDYSPKPDYFGILLPENTPRETLDMITALWKNRIFESKELASYAAERGLVFNPRIAGHDTADRTLPQK
ncbi:hypothetical protein [Marispirochaeta sp.]|uniref:hypothetical protein n=1 Tax=Marispirochaeta sp. TaxID=2038653 RepID=UPI0029C60727|nr:hypothetical protein [Marispirochaeta sp.]